MIFSHLIPPKVFKKHMYTCAHTIPTHQTHMYTCVHTIHTCIHVSTRATGWRRVIGCPKLQIIFHKRATKYKSLLPKTTYKDKGSYESSPPSTLYGTSTSKPIFEIIHTKVDQKSAIESFCMVHPPSDMTFEKIHSTRHVDKQLSTPPKIAQKSALYFL